MFASFTRYIWLTTGMIIVLAVSFAVYVWSEKLIDHANEKRQQSFVLAQELRQSSDDLTRMVRTYIATGNPIYKQHYQDILDIRNGVKPRPEQYYNVYWDLVMADGVPPRPDSSQTVSLLELLRRAGFTLEEFGKLEEAKANSDALTATEFEAMRLIETTDAEAARSQANRILYDARYHQAKASIMRPIGEFIDMMDRRTLQTVHRTENLAIALRSLFGVLGLGLILLLWRSYQGLLIALGGSVDMVRTHIQKIGQGDFSDTILLPRGQRDSVMGWLSQTQRNLRDLDAQNRLAHQSLAESESKLQAILNASQVAIAWADPDGRIEYVNSKFVSMFGYTLNDVKTVDQWYQLAYPDAGYRAELVAEWNRKVQRSSSDHSPIDPMEVQVTCKDGTVCYAILMGSWAGTRLLANFSDITARKLAEDKAQRLSNLYATLSQCNQAIVHCVDKAELFPLICRYAVQFGKMKMAWIAQADPATGIVRPAACFGDGVEYLQDIQVTFNPDHPTGRGPTGIALRTGLPVWCQDFKRDPMTFPWHEQAKRYGWGSSASLPLMDGDQVSGVLTLYAHDANAFDDTIQNLLVKLEVDISFALSRFSSERHRKQAEERIHHLAHFDDLTGLPNRTLLNDRVGMAISQAQRNQQTFAVLLLDLDHFKNVNDSLGHQVGDRLLVQLAERLKNSIRSEDTVSRLGGDEFVLLLSETDANGAGHVAEKLLATVSLPFAINQYQLITTPSIGIAIYPHDGADMDALFKSADAAMYRAKLAGRNSYCFFTPEMQKSSDRVLRVENALRHAVDDGLLCLHYQPQISLESGRVIGAEALLRWTHPELGSVSPAEFIPIAEETGQILKIGEWVLRSAMTQLRQWLDSGVEPFVMSVNLSSVQFRQSHLPQTIIQILEQSGIPPRFLELELTEGAAMSDPRAAVKMMDNLRRHGIGMSIDDFGTGYSSLSQLKRFRVSKLKIDQSFVRDILDDPEDKAIVSAVISLAKSLGMKAIAEGVETDAQLEYLRQQGCDEIQGYYYSKPLSADAFLDYLRTYR